MAKKKALPGKLAGKTVAFVGKFGYGGRDLEPMKQLVAAEGGTVVDGIKAPPDYLVAGSGVGGNPPAAVAKIQKKYPQIQAIDEVAFYQLVKPTVEEFRKIVLSGPHGHEFWSQMHNRLHKTGTQLDLTGSDFRNRNIEGNLGNVCLDECDFRGAAISAQFHKIKGARFDGARFAGRYSLSEAESCSFKDVRMEQTIWNIFKFSGCDFSRANFSLHGSCHMVADTCIFSKADLTEANLEKSEFKSTDFSGANLCDANLVECDFTGANLQGATLCRADLQNAKLGYADLRKATFNDSILSGADLTGARIDGADFTGAKLTGVNLTGLDPSKAKNLKETAARTAGPNMRELSKFARASSRFRTSIELDLGKDGYVELNASLSTYSGQPYLHAFYAHYKNNARVGTGMHAQTLEQSMLNLADRWSRGSANFETVKVVTKKCALGARDLRALAVAAWHEALGFPVPTADQMKKAAEQLGAETLKLRETMIAELSGGLVGVAKWNERSDLERRKLGKMRGHDFAKSKLVEVDLNRQDLERCCFDGADLKKANFRAARLTGTSFANAKLDGASLAGAKCSDTSFEGAAVSQCDLMGASFRRCDFRNANLTRSDLSFADIRGANFTDAILEAVKFLQTKFDETTVFDPGFIAPEELAWKGTGVRPGTQAPSPPSKAGTLDFDAFLAQLNNKVEAARMQKAGSMLKAERFQLFADVKDDHLVGVVKSQTSAELVYSCRLTSNGAFGCCTQNLRPCGGLRGALCKHLLVLIVGLAKAGQLDSATVDHWIDLSRGQKPAIDEEAMSATFLRYKGAEAGEIDWRPTETIPEDFYAM
jgi:uncharacterized protein YjbI with pentapeptide repeats